MLAAAVAVTLGGVEGAALAGCAGTDGSGATAPVFRAAWVVSGGGEVV
jgi:hypothetical protein